MIPVLDPSLVSPSWFSDNINSSAGAGSGGGGVGGGGGSNHQPHRLGGRNARLMNKQSSSGGASMIEHKDSNMILDDDNNDDGIDIDHDDHDDEEEEKKFGDVDDNGTDSTMETNYTSGDDNDAGGHRRPLSLPPPTEQPIPSAVVQSSSMSSSTLHHVHHHHHHHHRPQHSQSTTIASTTGSDHRRYNGVEENSISSYNNKNNYHQHHQHNGNIDSDDTKKWRSPVCIRLKTMSSRRRILLGLWLCSCVVIANVLSFAAYRESLFDVIDVDLYHVMKMLGLPVPLVPRPVEICFVTAQYTSSIDKKDNLVNLRREAPKLFNKGLSSYFHFFAFTNQKKLIVEDDEYGDGRSNKKSKNKNKQNDNNGWTVVVHPFYNFKRFITQSRWPKFQGHKHPVLQQTQCEVVFYMDGTVLPRGSVYQFQAEARRILKSQVGMSQEVHPIGGGVSGEMERCRLKNKDVEENLNATWTWLNEQPDFDDQCTLYQNTFFGYAVNSTSWNDASDFAWNRFSLEIDSWRDQPLWCYTLHHFHIQPLIIPPYLFEYQGNRRGKGKHTYGHEAATAAEDFLTGRVRETTLDAAMKQKRKQDAMLRMALSGGRTGPRVSAPINDDANENETREQRVERQRDRIERARKRNALRQSHKVTTTGGGVNAFSAIGGVDGRSNSKGNEV